MLIWLREMIVFDLASIDSRWSRIFQPVISIGEEIPKFKVSSFEIWFHRARNRSYLSGRNFTLLRKGILVYEKKLMRMGISEIDQLSDSSSDLPPPVTK